MLFSLSWRSVARWTGKKQGYIIERTRRLCSREALHNHDVFDAILPNGGEDMGFFDDALKGAVPGGDLATPIAIAAGALLLGKLFSGGSASPAPRKRGACSAVRRGGRRPVRRPDRSRCRNFKRPAMATPSIPGSALAPMRRSSRAQVGSALGQQTISNLARQSGPQRARIARPARAGVAEPYQQTVAERAPADAGRTRRAGSLIAKRERPAPSAPASFGRAWRASAHDGERLAEILDQILDVLQPDRKPHHALADAEFGARSGFRR